MRQSLGLRILNLHFYENFITITLLVYNEQWISTLQVRGTSPVDSHICTPVPHHTMSGSQVARFDTLQQHSAQRISRYLQEKKGGLPISSNSVSFSGPSVMTYGLSLLFGNIVSPQPNPGLGGARDVRYSITSHEQTHSVKPRMLFSNF